MTIIADRNDLTTATANRQAIERGLLNGGTVNLTAGVIHLDRGLQPVGPGVLAGMGMGTTTLRNSYATTPYGTNCTLNLAPAARGYGYVAGAKPLADGWSIATDDMTGLAPGATAYLWKWDGYSTPDGQCRQRMTVTSVDLAARKVTFNAKVDPKVTAVKWTSGVPIGDVDEGESTLAISLKTPAPAWPAPGADLFVTDGPSLGNEARGELRRCLSVAGGVVRLDRPLRQSYTSPVVLRTAVIRGLTVRDLTVAQPVHGGANALYAFGLVDCRFDRVEFAGNGSAVGGAAPIGGSSGLLLSDCVCSGGEIEFNNSHDVTIRGGRYESIRQEESCGDVRILDCRVGPAPVNGITSNPASPCERTTVRGVRIEGAGNMPLALGGRENVVEDVEVCRGGAPSYLAGAGLRVRGLRSDGAVYLQSGLGQSLAQVRAAGLALGWADPNWPASQGVAVDCDGPQVLGGKWQVWP